MELFNTLTLALASSEVLCFGVCTRANAESQCTAQYVNLFPFHLARQTVPSVNVQLQQKLPPTDKT